MANYIVAGSNPYSEGSGLTNTDGTYIETGVYGNKPYYKKAGVELYLYWDNGDYVWSVKDGLYSYATNGIFNPTDSPTPPQADWRLGYDPKPDITVTLESAPPADTTAPLVIGIEVQATGNLVNVTLNEAMAATPTSFSGFSATRDGINLTIVSATRVSNTVIEIQTTETVLTGETILVSWDGTDGITDVAGNFLAQFFDTPATNLSTQGTPSDMQAPTLDSATVNAAGDTLTLAFSEAVAGVLAAEFALSGATLSNVQGSGSTRTMTLSPVVTQGATPTLSYSGTGTVDASNNALATFSERAVTNDSTQPAPAGTNEPGWFCVRR